MRVRPEVRKSGRWWIFAVLLATLAVGGCATPATTAPAQTVATTDQALAQLRAGNERFVTGNLAQNHSLDRRQALVAGQKPFAVIVCCSDSRVPPELVFDLGLGDLFVVRVAGNVVDPVVLGSIEYAVEHLHAPLVVVLGHDKCGAVQAAVDGGDIPGSIGSITERIAASVARAKDRGLSGVDLTSEAIDLNVGSSMAAIEASPIVSHLEHDGKVKVVGARYHLETGQVSWH